jgi:hypothetical protein
MIRLILTEQIYRCFTIMNNKKYHYWGNLRWMHHLVLKQLVLLSSP